MTKNLFRAHHLFIFLRMDQKIKHEMMTHATNAQTRVTISYGVRTNEQLRKYVVGGVSEMHGSRLPAGDCVTLILQQAAGGYRSIICLRRHGHVDGQAWEVSYNAEQFRLLSRNVLCFVLNKIRAGQLTWRIRHSSGSDVRWRIECDEVPSLLRCFMRGALLQRHLFIGDRSRPDTIRAGQMQHVLMHYISKVVSRSRTVKIGQVELTHLPDARLSPELPLGAWALSRKKQVYWLEPNASDMATFCASALVRQLRVGPCTIPIAFSFGMVDIDWGLIAVPMVRIDGDVVVSTADHLNRILVDVEEHGFVNNGNVSETVFVDSADPRQRILEIKATIERLLQACDVDYGLIKVDGTNSPSRILCYKEDGPAFLVANGKNVGFVPAGLAGPGLLMDQVSLSGEWSDFKITVSCWRDAERDKAEPEWVKSEAHGAFRCPYCLYCSGEELSLFKHIASLHCRVPNIVFVVECVDDEEQKQMFRDNMVGLFHFSSGRAIFHKYNNTWQSFDHFAYDVVACARANGLKLRNIVRMHTGGGHNFSHWWINAGVAAGVFERFTIPDDVLG